MATHSLQFHFSPLCILCLLLHFQELFFLIMHLLELFVGNVQIPRYYKFQGFSLPPLAPFFSSSLLSLIPFVKQSHGTIFNLGFTSLI